jgi:Acetyltransferase (GNAT) family
MLQSSREFLPPRNTGTVATEQESRLDAKGNGIAPAAQGKSYVCRLQDGSAALRLCQKDWETEFFGRRFGRLEIVKAGVPDLPADALDKALNEVLSFGDRNGFDLIDLELDIAWLHKMHVFEDHGFRLVDTKMRFLSLMQRADMDGVPDPVTEVLFASEEMKYEILALTQRCFLDNPSFKSRFTNERYFSRSEAERYYSAWIVNHIGDDRHLFAVARDGGKIVGYLLYKRAGEHRGRPLYKAGLMAVAPEYRGGRVYFSLRSFVYRHFPEDEIYLDATTQLTNIAAIRNLVKMHRTFDTVQLVFCRRKGGE